MIQDRTYAIVDLTQLTPTLLQRARNKGLLKRVQATSIALLRKSLDNTKAIVWWEGDPIPDVSSIILWQGTRDDLLTQIDNSNWTVPLSAASRDVPVLGMAVSLKSVTQSTATFIQKYKWQLSVGVTGLAGIGAALATHYIWHLW